MKKKIMNHNKTTQVPKRSFTSVQMVHTDNRTDWNCSEKPASPSQPTLVWRFHLAPSIAAPPTAPALPPCRRFPHYIASRQTSIDGQNAEQNENLSSKELFPIHVRHVTLPSVSTPFEKSLAPVFRYNHVDGICPEKPVPTALLFQLRSLPTKLYACPTFWVWKLWQVLAAHFFKTIVSMIFVLKNPCQQQSIFLLSLPANQAMHVPSPSVCVQFFQANRIDGICPENPCQQLYFSVHRVLPTELSPSYFPRLPFRPPCRHSRIAPSHRSSPQAISHGFPRSFPPELSPSYFTWFPFRPPCRHSSIAPSHRSSPQAISHGFPSVHPVVTPVSLLPTGALPKLFHTVSLPSTLSSLPYRSFPLELSPSYFTWFPFRPPSCRFRIAPSHRSSPQAISHGFPSAHPVVIPVSLLPTGTLPKLFPTVSLPSTLSSLPYRSFQPELSPSYFTRFPFRPTCRHSSIAPSHRSSPQAISHGFPSVHPVVIPVSLLPTGALPKLFPTVSFPSTLSSLPHRSFPPELSPSYFKRFPVRPPCRHSSIAPFHRSSPQAISHGFPSVHPLVASVSLLPTGALPQAISHGSPSVHPLVASVPLLPTGALPKLFHTVSLPSTLSSPVSLLPTGALHKLFHTVSVPSTLSSFRYRSFPWNSPQAICFPSVHPVVTPVSLLPTGALHKLVHTVSLPSTLSSFQYRSFPPELSPSYFTRFPFRPPSCFRIAPSHRSSPQAISHGFPSVHPLVASVSLPFPPELSPSYFTRFPFRPPCRHSRIAPSHRSSPQPISHGFPSVHPVVIPVSLLPTGALPKLFHTVSLPSTLSSLPYRSFPPELSPSYFPRFPFRPPNRCFHPFPPSVALPMLFPTVSSPSTQ